MDSLKETFQKCREISDFFKSLNEEQIELFIKYGKENVENFGDEKGWKEVIRKIQND